MKERDFIDKEETFQLTIHFFCLSLIDSLEYTLHSKRIKRLMSSNGSQFPTCSIVPGNKIDHVHGRKETTFNQFN